MRTVGHLLHNRFRGTLSCILWPTCYIMGQGYFLWLTLACVFWVTCYVISSVVLYNFAPGLAVHVDGVILDVTAIAPCY